MSEESSMEPIKFKSRKKNLRKRKESSDEEDAEQDIESLKKLEEMKSIQKLRHRPNGVSIASLIVGEKVAEEEELMVKDPFKAKTGGLVNMASLKGGQVKNVVDDAYDTGIGTQFSAETNKRDEDEEMMKYIDEQLSKRKKGEADKSGLAEESSGGVQYCSPEEAALQAVPDHLRQTTTVTSEEMLSNQMLSGIPEVDLGIEAKIRNIEATEDAKVKLLWDRHNKKDGPSQFVPTNMAVNFVQHNRFNIEDTGPPKKKERLDAPPPPKRPTNNARDGRGSHEKKKDGTEKATDDYHYEKFKKQFRRY